MTNSPILQRPSSAECKAEIESIEKRFIGSQHNLNEMRCNQNCHYH